MLLILKKKYFLRYDRPTILYGVNLWLKPISAAATTECKPSAIATLGIIRPEDIGVL